MSIIDDEINDDNQFENIETVEDDASVFRKRLALQIDELLANIKTNPRNYDTVDIIIENVIDIVMSTVPVQYFDTNFYDVCIAENIENLWRLDDVAAQTIKYKIPANFKATENPEPAKINGTDKLCKVHVFNNVNLQMLIIATVHEILLRKFGSKNSAGFYEL